jgi:hypothetical protein
MANYYVNPAADAGGDGTTTATTGAHCAFKTVAQVVSATFAAGDYVMFIRDGVWREALTIGESGSAGAKLTYMDYGSGALPAITGADLVTTWTNHSGNIWSATLATEPHVVIFDGTVGTHVAAHDDCDGAGDWVWESGTLFCYAASDPDTLYTAPGVEAGTSRWCVTTNYATAKNYVALKNLHLYGFDGAPGIHAVRTTGWNIEGLTIDKGARTGIQMLAATDLTIHDCTMTGIRELTTAWKAIYCYPESSTFVGGNIAIHDNTVNDWTGYGVHVLGYSYAIRCHDVDVYSNDLSHNTTGGYFSYCDTGNVYLNTCDDNLIGGAAGEEYGIAFQTVSNFNCHQNTCTNGRCGMEIWAWIPGEGAFPLSGPSENNQVYRNEFAGNTEHGFLIYEGNCNNTQVYRNLMYHNHMAGAAISENSLAPTGCVFRHNTLYNNNQGEHGYADLFFGGTCAGWTVKNNVIYNNYGAALRCTHASGFTGTHDYNLYYKSSGNIIDNHGTYYTAATITDWEPHAISADPLFTSTVSGSTSGGCNFTPQAGSPLIDAATDLGDTVDYYGNGIV